MVSILIVDDSKLIQKSLAQEFGKNNFFNLIFTGDYQSTQQAIAQEQNIFAAIVSMVLPDALNGEAIDLTLLHKIPTIVLTGNLSDEVVKTYSSKPIIDYVPKTSIHDILYTVEMIEILFYFQGAKALVVDDSQTFQYYLSVMFKNLMLEPVLASSGQEALDILAKDQSIQVVSVDYGMPGMNGLDLIQRINTKYGQRNLSVLAVTAEEDGAVVSKFIKSGADDLLNKPITKETFNSRVFKILSFKKKMLEVDNYLKTMEQYVLTSSTDEKGIIRNVSQSFSDLSGFTKEELVGNTHRMVRHPDMPDEIFKELWETILSGKSWEGEIKNRTKNGGYYWVAAHISPIYNNSQKVIGYQSIRQDITAKKSVEEKSRQLEEAKKNITDSIEFASIIQRTFLPDDRDLQNFFDDHFVCWMPKDIVGGDIYQFLVHEHQSLLFMIDCTGHGVPGAFMTMVVKTALESIVNDSNKENPAKILQALSRTIKALLKQHDEEAQSDAGLDGGVFFYDKQKKLVRYAGAKTPLFYITDGELKVFKSDRESIGYKKSNENFEFSNFEYLIEKPTYFYITTDGYIDQNGGEGGFPYGKKKFQKTILSEYQRSFSDQKDILIKQLLSYQGDHERDDDITMCGFCLGTSIDSKGVGLLTNAEVDLFVQDMDRSDSDTMNQLEQKIQEYLHDEHKLRSKLEKILTVLYELGQNLIKYRQSSDNLDEKDRWRSLLTAGSVGEELFYLRSSNIVNHAQKEVIQKRIEQINAMDHSAVKLYYKELRRSGLYKHDNGAGLGFAELAKRSSRKLEYSFTSIDDVNEYYELTVYI